jgi:tetratricopeptide (TPR) repeat protein
MIWPQLRAARITISLGGRSRAVFFLLAVTSASLFLAAEACLVGRVSSFKTLSEGARLLAIDPDDPRLEFRLGRVYSRSDPNEGIRHLRRATELSPYSRRYWSHLAFTCESLADTQCADQGWELLAKLCPMVPLYHWHAGQSYLRTDHIDDSLAQFRVLLDLDSQYGPKVWFALRSVLDPDVIFQKTVAQRADSETKVAYIDFLSDQGDYDAAFRIWRSVAPNLHPVSFTAAKPYLDHLIADDRIDEAETVWLDLRRMGIVTASGMTKDGNLIFNGDFEQVPLNAGFDWRQSDQATYLAIDFAAPGAYHGTHCLRVDFTVKRNEAYEPIYQVVPILPNHTYKLEAYVRSEDITSDTGPYLRVSDPQHSSFEDALSETTVGTTPWHSVRLDFSTGPEAQSVRLSIWRPRGRTFPMEISGSLWVDSVSLHDMGHAAGPAAGEGQR